MLTIGWLGSEVVPEGATPTREEEEFHSNLTLISSADSIQHFRSAHKYNSSKACRDEDLRALASELGQTVIHQQHLYAINIFSSKSQHPDLQPPY